MAKPITVQKWKAADGQLYDSEKAADEHDRQRKVITEINELLAYPAEDPGCRFANGGYSLPQDREDYAKACQLFWENIDPKWRDRFHPQVDGFVGRYLDDNGHFLYGTWSRLICVKRGRIYGQPYYANHPDEVKENR